MEQAIKKAIEGGYKWHGRDFTIEYKGVNDKYQSNRHIFIEGEGYVLDDHWLNSFLLDPDFWKCLGEAEKWNISHFTKEGVPAKNHRGKRSCTKYCGKNKEWLSHWHRFIDHLAEGRDIDSYFKELLNH